MNQDEPKTCPPQIFKETLYSNLKDFGMPLDPHFENTYQQTT